MKLDRFRSAEGEAPFPLTAMIDVLFLMIIFLVLGANFEQTEQVRLPEARGEPGAMEAVVAVALRADGTLLLDGEALSYDALVPALRQRAPERILLLPDQQAAVGVLFRWYERLRRDLRVPVRVGVRPPRE